MEWQLNKAKTHLGTLVTNAATEPQFITKHGEKAAVVLSIDTYEDIQELKRQKLLSFVGTLSDEDGDRMLEEIRNSRVNKDIPDFFAE